MENLEKIVKNYIKSNKTRREVILKKYGVKSLEKLKNMFSTQNSEIVLGRTEIAALFCTLTNQELTVDFNKSVKTEDVLSEIMEVYKNSTPNNVEREFKKILNTALKGERKVVKITHNGILDTFGRIFAVNLDEQKKENQKSDSRMILIGLQNINSITLTNGTKYVKKG